MNNVLNENSLDWALIHLTRYCDNDFFPPIFEFELAAKDWREIRSKTLSIDLETHIARPPLARYAANSAGSFRIVYRLDPLDALMYTALVHEMQGERQRATREVGSGVAGALHIEPAADGSFFRNWQNASKSHIDRLEELADDYQARASQNTGGCILTADIQDLLGYIQPNRLVYKLIDSSAVSPGRARILGRALFALFPTVGRGIPAGSAASTVLAETILEEVDKKVLHFTPDYTRWGAELYAFFRSKEEAREALRDLSRYLLLMYSMTLTPEKTRIVQVNEFRFDERDNAGSAEERMNEIIGQNFHAAQYGWMNAPLPPMQPEGVHERIRELPEFQTAGTVYKSHLDLALASDPPDLGAASRIMRKACAYGISSILPAVLAHFQKLTPVIRDAATYLKGVLDQDNVRTYTPDIRNAWEETKHLGEYIHDWWCHVLTSRCFNEIDLPSDINEIVGNRNQALIALRKNDFEWVRRNAAHLEAFDLWSRRALLYACSVLQPDERTAAAGVVRRGIMEQSVARHLKSGMAGTPNSVGTKDWVKPEAGNSIADSDGNTTCLPQPDPSTNLPQPYNPPTTYLPRPDLSSTRSSHRYPSTDPPRFEISSDQTGSSDEECKTGAPEPNSVFYGQPITVPDSYPAYGNKAVQPGPRWLMERVPELDALLRKHSSEIMVSFQDSVDSGNCMSGTEIYRRELLARLGLPPHTLEVQAGVLLADRDDPLIRRAARVAALRWASQHAAADTDASVHAGTESSDRRG